MTAQHAASRPTAASVPTTPPVRLSRTDSIRIIRTMRRRRQPIARKMPISRVRSKTDMIIVFNMPTAPMMIAMAEVIHDIAWMKRISVVEVTDSSAVLASIILGPRRRDRAEDPFDFGLVVGMIDHDGSIRSPGPADP